MNRPTTVLTCLAVFFSGVSAGVGGTSQQSVDWLWNWVQTDDDGWYECRWDWNACKRNFLVEAKEERICRQCPDSMAKIDRVICVGRKVQALLKGSGKMCYGHAGAMEEALDECGISADLVSHWDSAKKVGHSWLQIDIEGGIMYADSLNNIYMTVTSSGRRLLGTGEARRRNSDAYKTTWEPDCTSAPTRTPTTPSPTVDCRSGKRSCRAECRVQAHMTRVRDGRNSKRRSCASACDADFKQCRKNNKQGNQQ